MVELQRKALDALTPEPFVERLTAADSLFRRCQRLKRSAVGLVVVDADGTSTDRAITLKAVLVSERGEVEASRSVRSGTPNELIVRERREGPPLLAVGSETGSDAAHPSRCATGLLQPLPFGTNVPTAISPEVLSEAIAGAKTTEDAATRVRWTHIQWMEDGRHRLDIRLPGMCTRVPVPYGGESFESSPGLDAFLWFDDDFRAPDRAMWLKHSVSLACDAAGDLEHASSAKMFQSAFCARLRGVPLDKVRNAWIKRCDALARVEEVWGAKHWNSGKAAVSPEAKSVRPDTPPRLCFQETDRLWDADYTAQSSHQRPNAIMPDELADLLGRVVSLL